jgi:tetratricopeptide (TPR) repeat protein
VARAAGSGDERPPWTPEETWIEESRIEEPTEQADARRRAPARDRAGASAVRLRDLATGREGVASPGGRRRRIPSGVVAELSAAGPSQGAKLSARLADATYAYERERYDDARRLLRVLADQAPGSAAVRELYGLVLYRQGNWRQAAQQLEVYRQLSGSFDQHPVLADCYRGLRRFDDAESIWAELREASPDPDLVAEGRIVAAGCLADQGRLADAIALLERGIRKTGHPKSRHLRQWYALADLYEQAGDLPRARDLFGRVAAVDPDAFEVRQRLRALR